MAGCAARVPPGSEARLSLATFLLGASVLALPLLTRAGLQGRTGLALYVAGLNALLLLLYRPPRYQELKQITWVSATGLLMVVFGECLRKAAMFTAGSNFNHVVQSEKSDTHTLVTSGVYAWCRHPSYVGWFYWSIGTQVMLCNPICGVVYALTVWRFFRDRTEEEEISLIHFFGDEYLDYKKRVPTGLPFIKGVKVEL
ncbi:Protein-S-isoprenylcysteine O-methyltransferase [Apodemus speciosus]|uniref:Protein-S-isoprenylcysteine O-methyltransferase n=1 Tax=Apodemus speciosus TaxID=105296 RepID=A0ABQ0EQY1_APOSI